MIALVILYILINVSATLVFGTVLNVSVQAIVYNVFKLDLILEIIIIVHANQHYIMKNTRNSVNYVLFLFLDVLPAQIIIIVLYVIKNCK